MSIDTFKEIVDAIVRVSDDPDAFLLMTVNGLVLRIYPGRIVAIDERSRMKRFAAFVLALRKMADVDAVEFSLRSALSMISDEYVLDVGVHSLDQTIWMPCAIERVEAPGPVSFTVPVDNIEEAETTLLPLTRRIVL